MQLLLQLRLRKMPKESVKRRKMLRLNLKELNKKLKRLSSNRKDKTRLPRKLRKSLSARELQRLRQRRLVLPPRKKRDSSRRRL